MLKSFLTLLGVTSTELTPVSLLGLPSCGRPESKNAGRRHRRCTTSGSMHPAIIIISDLNIEKRLSGEYTYDD